MIRHDKGGSSIIKTAKQNTMYVVRVVTSEYTRDCSDWVVDIYDLPHTHWYWSSISLAPDASISKLLPQVVSQTSSFSC